MIRNPEEDSRTLDRYQDGLLRPLSTEIAGEYTTAYGYDAANRLASVWHQPALDATTKAPAGAADFAYTYEPDSYGLVKAVTRTGGHTVANTWEEDRNVLLGRNNHTGTPASPVSKYDYEILSNGNPTGKGANSIGQRTSLITSGSAFATAPAYTWSYNGAGELTEADDTSSSNNDRAFQYDAIGNREKTVNGLADTLGAAPVNYVANSLNQYTTANGVALPTTPAPAPYDEDGNMTRGPLPASDAGTHATLVWDAENRLVSATVTKNTVTTTTNYSYDAQSRRTVKQVVGGSATLYIHDGWNLIAEYSGTTLTKTYTWGMDLSGSMQGAGGVGGLLAVKEGSASYYPTFDGNGNVSEYLDSNNVVQAHYEYDAFGNTLVATGPKKDDFAHRFSNKYHDAETGLYYYGYRYYDPTTGRWPSRDPIREAGGPNLYGFVGNCVVNKFDYLGLESLCDTCEKGKKLGEADEGVKTLIDRMKEKGCKLPTVKCRCKEKGEKGGGHFDHVTNAIALFCNSVAGSNYFKLLTIHEYAHAYDSCFGLKATDCAKRACLEIRAYKFAQCAGLKDPVKKEECVRKGAEESVGHYCRNASGWVKSAWKNCY
ncbi:MAG: hypothetical protein H7A51_05000 [Akkermansiaceae bacterium]|nr:hypothetical protein [Akkermansiaceae bacterium]